MTNNFATMLWYHFIHVIIFQLHSCFSNDHEMAAAVIIACGNEKSLRDSLRKRQRAANEQRQGYCKDKFFVNCKGQDPLWQDVSDGQWILSEMAWPYSTFAKRKSIRQSIVSDEITLAVTQQGWRAIVILISAGAGKYQWLVGFKEHECLGEDMQTREAVLKLPYVLWSGCHCWVQQSLTILYVFLWTLSIY